MQLYALLIMMCNEFEVGQRTLPKIVFHSIAILVLVSKALVVYREVAVQGREPTDIQTELVGSVNTKINLKIFIFLLLTNFWSSVEYLCKSVIHQPLTGICQRNLIRNS